MRRSRSGICPLKHPVNLAYEAATADLADVNMIDPFHLEAYGETTVNYNRDIEIYPGPRDDLPLHLRRVPVQEPDGHGRQHGGLRHLRRRGLPRGVVSGDHPPLLCLRLRRQEGHRHARGAAQAGDAHELPASGRRHAQDRPRRPGQSRRDRRARRRHRAAGRPDRHRQDLRAHGRVLRRPAQRHQALRRDRRPREPHLPHGPRSPSSI